MKKLKIGGYSILITYDNEILANESRLGEFSHFNQRISLAKVLPAH